MKAYNTYIDRLIKFYKARNIKIPISVSYEITNQCNLFCEHCYNKDKMKSTKDSLLLPEKIILLQKLKQLGTEEIIICGGEPFLDDNIFEVIRNAKMLKFRLIILTNGLLIDKSTIKFLKNTLADGDYIQLSIDEFFENDKNLQRNISTIQNIKIKECLQGLLDMHIPIVVNITPTKLNQNYIINIVKTVSDMGVENIGFTPYVPMGGALSDEIKPDYSILEKVEITVEEYLKKRKVNYLGGLSGHPCQKKMHITNENANKQMHYNESLRSCIAAHYNIHINYYGEIYPCVFLEHEKFYIANIVDSIDEIKNRINIVCGKIISPYPEKCKLCDIISDCNGGCIGLIIDRYNDINNYDPRCVR